MANPLQAVCEPGKIVLTKTPGSCIPKHASAATWKGKVLTLPAGCGRGKQLKLAELALLGCTYIAL